MYRSPGSALLLALVLVSGCVAGPDASSPPLTPEAPSSFDEAQDGPASTDDPAEAEDSDPPANTAQAAERDARGAALRLRATGPDLFGPSTGSGFAIGTHTVLTNRHVVVGADRVDLVSWDGESETSSDITVSYLSDLASVATRARVPVEPLELAAADPRPGDSVLVTGFPGGGQIEVETDVRVVDITDGSEYLETGPVIELAARTIEPGSSGGPVINEDNEVAGVIFAIDRDTGHALAIPASVVRLLLEQ